MKELGEAARLAARHRKFLWCRRPNGFSDMPVWRLVALRCDLPLPYVLAFVNRLEELANEAANFSGEIRGSVNRFSAEEFALALGISIDEAARIRAALEEPGVDWIAYDHVATFYDRNPDREDKTAPERSRRTYHRKKVMSELARLAHLGWIDEATRRRIETSLKAMGEGELLAIKAELAKIALDRQLSTLQKPHAFSRRENVRLTPEQSTGLERANVDNSGDADVAPGAGPAGAGAEPPEQTNSDPARWLDSDGRELVVLRLEVVPNKAEQMIERWRRDLQDDAALKEIIQGAVSNLHSGAKFHIVIADGVQRFVRERQQGGQLPLPGATRPVPLNAKRSSHG